MLLSYGRFLVNYDDLRDSKPRKTFIQEVCSTMLYASITASTVGHQRNYTLHLPITGGAQYCPHVITTVELCPERERSLWTPPYSRSLASSEYSSVSTVKIACPLSSLSVGVQFFLFRDESLQEISHASRSHSHSGVQEISAQLLAPELHFLCVIAVIHHSLFLSLS